MESLKQRYIGTATVNLLTIIESETFHKKVISELKNLCSIKKLLKKGANWAAVARLESKSVKAILSALEEINDYMSADWRLLYGEDVAMIYDWQNSEYIIGFDRTTGREIEEEAAAMMMK